MIFSLHSVRRIYVSFLTDYLDSISVLVYACVRVKFHVDESVIGQCTPPDAALGAIAMLLRPEIDCSLQGFIRLCKTQERCR